MTDPRAKSRTGTWLHALARALFSPYCRLCGDPGQSHADICAACASELPWLGPACPLCTRPMPLRATPCGQCQRQPLPLTGAHAALRYSGEVATLVRRFKFDGDLAVGRLLGQLLARRMAAHRLPPTTVPVPLHPARLRERGFNQASELARHLPGGLLHGRVARIRAAPPQSLLGARERRRSPVTAFAVTGRPLPPAVTLVDDVITTGATVSALARCLRRAGVEEIHLVCLATANGT